MNIWMHLCKLLRDRSNATLNAEILDMKTQLDILEHQVANDANASQVVKHCREQLEVLIRVAANGQRDTAWRLLHRLQEEILLAIPFAQLTAEWQRIKQALQSSAMSDAAKREWSGKVEAELPPRDGDQEKKNFDEMPARYMIKMAANYVNDVTDDTFWDIWTKRWLSMIYLGALAVLLLIMLVCYGNEWISPIGQLTFGKVLLLGAIGGLASGVWGSQECIAKSYFWVGTIYYSLVKPVSGIIGAILMLWLLLGQSYIMVDPPLKPNQLASASYHRPRIVCASRCTTTSEMDHPCSYPTSMPTTTPPCHPAALTSDPTSTGGDKPNALITFHAPHDMAIFPHMLLLLIAGFAGDRILRGVTDKVMTKLFVEAEKTKTLPSGTV